MTAGEWWYVEDRHGNRGYVPHTYLKTYPHSTAAAAATATAEGGEGGSTGPDEGGAVAAAAAAAAADSDGAGRQFNRKTFGLSFGLKNGLRFHFDSKKCLNNPFLKIFLV